MSEEQRPPDDPEPTRLDSEDLPGGSDDTTRVSGEKPDAIPTGKRLGDFELLRELGRGGMGIVYEARQLSLKRRVALKVLPPALGMSPQAKQRFEREAQAAAKLHHTNIVPVHAIGEHDGHHFYAMELIDGQSLDHVLRDMVDEGSNPLMEATVTQTVTALRSQRPATTPQEQATTSLSDTSAGGRQWFDTVAKLVADSADALHYAHGRGVIHRDIKPANLMLSREGHLSITDFGLARLLEEPGMTVSGSFLGTPAYMAPEQIAAGRIKVDHRADIYSLGAVLYEMLTMQRPFAGQSREQVLAAVMTKDPRRPRRLNGKIPVDLETICLKALEKDVDRRYATAGEMAQDLRQYLQGGLITARRAGVARRTWKSIRRHPVAFTAVVAALIVVAALAIGWQAGGRAMEAQRLVADARLALREGTYRDGLEIIDRAVALNPDSIDARLVRARLLAVNYRHREAADEARSILQTDPKNYSAHAILAGLALDPDNQFRLVSIDPEPHLQVVDVIAPDSAEAYYLRALGTKDTRQRIELLDRALDLDPAYQLASMARMTALAGLKDFELELSEAERLIATRPKSAQGWRAKAYAYVHQQDFKNAENAIERAIAVDDRDPWNYSARSTILWDTGKKDEALTELARGIELDSTQAYLYEERARQLNALGRFEKAIADALKSIELNPDDRGAFGVLLSSYLKLGHDDLVRSTIDELRTRAEGWFDVGAKAWAYGTIANCYGAMKDYDLAMESVERAIEIAPDDYFGFMWRLRIHKDLGDDAGAEADCDAAARIELDELETLFDRALFMAFWCDRRERAIEDFNRVIKLAPKWHGVYAMRGLVYHELKRDDEALADMNKAIELAPLVRVSYLNRALVYETQGRFEEMLADTKRTIEISPYDVEGWSAYGASLVYMGRLQEALAAEDKALKVDPLHGDARTIRADVLAWLGRCDEAAVELHEAEELLLGHPYRDRGQIASVCLFAFYYNCPGHYDPAAALRHAQSAYEAHPEFQRRTLADALFRKGDYAEAKRIYLEVYEENPESTWFGLSMCLWHLGEKAQARSWYDRSVTWMEERLPDSPLLKRQRQEAAELLGIEP